MSGATPATWCHGPGESALIFVVVFHRSNPTYGSAYCTVYITGIGIPSDNEQNRKAQCKPYPNRVELEMDPPV
jgi:hypothetical protein